MNFSFMNRFSITFSVFRRLCRQINSFSARTHTCGELNSSHVDQNVVVCGWTTFHRLDKFIVLRDAYGCTQIIFKENDNLARKFLKSLPLESVVQVKGVVQKRPPKDINKGMSTGEIEVKAEEIQLLNSSLPKLPIVAKDQSKVTDTTKLKYRYLSLRNPKIQENLRLRSTILMKMREFLHDKHGFVDVETPTLFKRTPGGAKEFIVPTKFPGLCYSLTQSPQQFKQMLMVGGIDRYFQIARCYRNEGTKHDRQPEFTQLDIEISFTTAKDIYSLIELLLKHSWPKNRSIKTPFPSMTYADAIRLYGTDKPDIRYELKIQNLTKDLTDSGLDIASKSASDPDFILGAIVLPNGKNLLKNSFIKELQKDAEQISLNFYPISIKDNMSWTSAISKHVRTDVQNNINKKYNVKPGDVIFLAAGKYMCTSSFLGKLRIKCADYLRSNGVDLTRWDEYAFVWITDFPLFLQNETGALESAHHPFTAPHPVDVELVYTNPKEARSQHYDLVLNGQEVGGGSIRVHDPLLQKYILEDILKESTSNLKHLLDALASGCPPHGGIALGIDRILAIVCGCHSITDVIAFPKSMDGKDLMSGAPSPITEEDQRIYHIKPIMPKLN
ncbi:aspartate--tRNA ligase, mitochondrial-like [Uloborus diversus]|uniref:aspartate--tRNA ligase, mitochondrial-like n=1 Tax=Uloborus diversus TaxID=327109 RepID=UPI002409E203|nr:aspartate--tRNA ligase, mitochondrial-like [Uloborus diversus]